MPRTNKSTSATGLYAEGDISRKRDRVMAAEFNKLVDEVAELKTALAAHVHGGVTTGSADTAVPDTITYANPEADYIG